MMFFDRRSLALGALLLTAGCSKSFFKAAPMNLPPYIHKIAVRPFTNHTPQYGLEDKLTLATQSEFNRDGRIQITSEDQADGIVVGDITKYILEPLSYDNNHVPTEYKLTILVNVSFIDKVKSQTLWIEPSMIGELRYFVASSGFAGSLTEADAQTTIWDQLSRDIATRTFEGVQTGAVGKSTSGQSNGLRGQQDKTPPPQPNPQPPSPSPMQQPY
jgi:hypothetical protein